MIKPLLDFEGWLFFRNLDNIPQVIVGMIFFIEGIDELILIFEVEFIFFVDILHEILFSCLVHLSLELLVSHLFNHSFIGCLWFMKLGQGYQTLLFTLVANRQFSSATNALCTHILSTKWRSHQLRINIFAGSFLLLLSCYRNFLHFCRKWSIGEPLYFGLL